jgi:hypothetical protein
MSDKESFNSTFNYALDYIISYGKNYTEAEAIMEHCIAHIRDTLAMSHDQAKDIINKEYYESRFDEMGHWTPLFPYFYLYSEESALDLFTWLKNRKPEFSRVKSVKYSAHRPYLVPFQFKDRQSDEFLVIDSSSVPYEKESITDFYTECARMEAKRHFMKETPMEMYVNGILHNLFIKDYHRLSKPAIKRYREGIYKVSKEPTLFRVTWAKTLYYLLSSGKKSLKIFDPCSGWGDRMIAALSLGNGATTYNATYHGVDPSSVLEPKYKLIAQDFDPSGKSHVTRSPIENYTIDDPGSYDIVFTSPPYFTMEIYSSEPEQSTTRYETFKDWSDGFFTPLMQKSAFACRTGGYVAIHISDYKVDGKDVPLVDTMFKITKSIRGLVYRGVIFLRGESNRDWPVWIWSKE